MLLYYITDRAQFPGTESDRRNALLERVAEAARCGVDFIQLREKDLSTHDLEILASLAVEKVRESGSATRILINSRADIAMAAGVDGLHLRSNDITPADVGTIWAQAVLGTPVIAVSCHTENEVRAAQKHGAAFVVFGPVFGKQISGQLPTGLEMIRCVSTIGAPVLALGGITIENAASCTQAGAAGIAGIRLFQLGDLEETVKKLRSRD